MLCRLHQSPFTHLCQCPQCNLNLFYCSHCLDHTPQHHLTHFLELEAIKSNYLLNYPQSLEQTLKTLQNLKNQCADLTLQLTSIKDYIKQVELSTKSQHAKIEEALKFYQSVKSVKQELEGNKKVSYKVVVEQTRVLGEREEESRELVEGVRKVSNVMGCLLKVRKENELECVEQGKEKENGWEKDLRAIMRRQEMILFNQSGRLSQSPHVIKTFETSQDVIRFKKTGECYLVCSSNGLVQAYSLDFSLVKAFNLRKDELIPNNLYDAVIMGSHGFLISTRDSILVARDLDDVIALDDLQHKPYKCAYYQARHALVYTTLLTQLVVSFFDDKLKLRNSLVFPLEDQGYSLYIDEEHDQILCGDKMGNLYVWKLEDKNLRFIAKFKAHSDFITGITRSSDSLLTTGLDKKIKSWSAKAQKFLIDKEQTHFCYLTCLAKFQDNLTLTGDQNGSKPFKYNPLDLILWKCSTLEKMLQFQGHNDVVQWIKVEKDSTILTCSKDTKAKIWDLF